MREGGYCSCSGAPRRSKVWQYVLYCTSGLVLSSFAVLNINDDFPYNVTHTLAMLVGSGFCFALNMCGLRETLRLLDVLATLTITTQVWFLLESLLRVGHECATSQCPSVVGDHSAEGAAGFAIALVLVVVCLRVAKWSAHNFWETARIV